MSRLSDTYEAALDHVQYQECLTQLGDLWTGRREMGAFDCLSKTHPVLHSYALRLARSLPNHRRKGLR